MSIYSDGSVGPCCNLVGRKTPIGNVNDNSIHEIWHGKTLQKIRDLHEKKDGFKEITACKNCYYPRKMEEDEKAIVNGREIRIENYINRSQEVGK